MKFIVLDSTPLGLVTQRQGAAEAGVCRQWIEKKTAAGCRVVVPEIIDYELRRELIRSKKFSSIARLDRFVNHPAVTFLPITTTAMKLAAALWAKARQQGTPTADDRALDIDVILSAQVLSAGFEPGDFVVATTNVGHLSLFVTADSWSAI